MPRQWSSSRRRIGVRRQSWSDAWRHGFDRHAFSCVIVQMALVVCRKRIVMEKVAAILFAGVSRLARSRANLLVYRPIERLSS